MESLSGIGLCARTVWPPTSFIIRDAKHEPGITGTAQQQGSTPRAPNKNAYVKGHNPMRRCGDCQLCCTLLPAGSLSKSAGALCKFTKFKKGSHAHHDPALRRWLYRRAKNGIAALIRFNERDAITVFATPFDPARQWDEIDSGLSLNRTHSFEEVVTALGGRAAATISEPEKGEHGKAINTTPHRSVSDHLRGRGRRYGPDHRPTLAHGPNEHRL